METQSPYTMVFFVQVIIRVVFIMTTLHRKLAKMFFFFVFQMILVLHMLFLSLSWTSVMLCLMCLQILLFIDFSIVRLQLLKYTQKKKHICNLLSLYSSMPEKIGIQHEILWGDLTKSIASTPVYLEDFCFIFFFTLKSPNVLLLEGNLVFVCSPYYLQKLLGQRILVMQHLK